MRTGINLIPTAHAAGILGDLGNSSADMATLGDATNLIVVILNLIFVLSGIVTVVMILWGSFTLFAAGGDPSKAQKSKQIITAAFIGAAIIILAASMVRLYVQILGGAA